MYSGPDEVPTGEKAGFWIRAVATVLDWFILWAADAAFGVVVGVVDRSQSPGGAEPLLMLGSVLPLPFQIAYFLFFWTYSGQTLGHKILGLRVIRTDGRSLGLGTATIRFLGELLSWLPLGLGLFWVAFDSNKQGWHDKIAGTYVIRVDRHRSEQPPSPEVASLGDVFGERTAE